MPSIFVQNVISDGSGRFLAAMPVVLETAAPISSVAAAGDDVIIVGTARGQLQTWRLGGAVGREPCLLAERRLAELAPVSQLQVLPAVGLVVHRCAGVVRVDAFEQLQLVATLHASRATSFHANASARVSSLAVAAGHSMLWVYELASIPRLMWRKLLPQPTRAVHLRSDCALVACVTSCFLMDASSGHMLAELSLYPCTELSGGAGLGCDAGLHGTIRMRPAVASAASPVMSCGVGEACALSPPADARCDPVCAWNQAIEASGAAPHEAWRSSGCFVSSSETEELLLLLPDMSAAEPSATAGAAAPALPVAPGGSRMDGCGQARLGRDVEAGGDVLGDSEVCAARGTAIGTYRASQACDSGVPNAGLACGEIGRASSTEGGRHEVAVWLSPSRRALRPVDDAGVGGAPAVRGWELLPGLIALHTPTSLVLRSLNSSSPVDAHGGAAGRLGAFDDTDRCLEDRWGSDEARWCDRMAGPPAGTAPRLSPPASPCGSSYASRSAGTSLGLPLLVVELGQPSELEASCGSHSGGGEGGPGAAAACVHGLHVLTARGNAVLAFPLYPPGFSPTRLQRREQVRTHRARSVAAFP